MNESRVERSRKSRETTPVYKNPRFVPAIVGAAVLLLVAIVLGVRNPEVSKTQPTGTNNAQNQQSQQNTVTIITNSNVGDIYKNPEKYEGVMININATVAKASKEGEDWQLTVFTDDANKDKVIKVSGKPANNTEIKEADRVIINGKIVGKKGKSTPEIAADSIVVDTAAGVGSGGVYSEKGMR